MYYLFVFSTLTRAQRGAKVLNSSGISAAVVQSPRGAVENGCTHGVKVAQNHYSKARNEFAKAGIWPRKAYTVLIDGSVREVNI